MSTADQDGYGSRKFLITGGAILCTTGLAMLSKVDANVALVFVACVGAYNWANLRHHQSNGDHDE